MIVCGQHGFGVYWTDFHVDTPRLNRWNLFYYRINRGLREDEDWGCRCLFCLLWRDKARVKEKTYKSVPLWIWDVRRTPHDGVFIITVKEKVRRGGGRRCRCYERRRDKTWENWILRKLSRVSDKTWENWVQCQTMVIILSLHTSDVIVWLDLESVPPRA